MRTLIVMLAVLLASSCARKESDVFSGSVYSLQDSLPIAGAYVYERHADSTVASTTTDEEGRFVLNRRYREDSIVIADGQPETEFHFTDIVLSRPSVEGSFYLDDLALDTMFFKERVVIRGVVLDSRTGRPLDNVEYTSDHPVSTLLGRFQLRADQTDSILTLHRAGYADQRIKLAKRKQRIRMVPNPS